MRRADLEHVIRAAADIADDDEIVVIGSQAVLGQFPDPPAELCVSVEADVYPKNRPERADLIDGSIGEGSPFHETYGYYAQGVGESTATLPAGWQARLVPRTSFLEAAGRHGLLDPAVLQDRVAQTDLSPKVRELVLGRLARV